MLLFSLVVLVFGIYPFLGPVGPARLFADLAVSLVLLLGAYSVSSRRWVLVATFSLGMVALGLRWSGRLLDQATLAELGQLGTLAFLIIVVIGVFVRVVESGPITRHRIEGAIATYLLLGVLWTMAYGLVETYSPGSFNLSETASGALGIENRLPELLHFSFTTLTTLGYGDIVPLKPGARSLATLEALVGQLYLAILVARLVALQIAGARSGDEPA